MKIMVVGSSGYIGRHVVKHVAAQARMSSPSISSRAGAMVGARRAVHPRQHDQSRRSHVGGLGKWRPAHRRPGLLHDAAAPPECRDLLNAARVNIIGVTNLFEAARLAKIQRVIFASTVGIFGYQDGYGPQPIDENTEPRAPKSLYGLMKLVNNGLAERYTKTYGVQIVKVHSAAVIGPGNTAFSKRMIQDPALGKPGFANWPSTGPRNIVGVGDIAQLYTKMALANEVKHDTYMGTGPSPTGNELASIVKKYLRAPKSASTKRPVSGLELQQLPGGERIRLEDSVGGRNGIG